MCGRYFIAEDDTAEDLQQIIEQVNRRYNGETPLKVSGEIFPTDTVPVIANSRSMMPTPFAMRWGYTVPDRQPLINARSEPAAAKIMFKDGMAQMRCLIPAIHYFECEKRGREKIKYAIRPTESGTLYMAGIYRVVAGQPEFSILTRDPAQSIAFIHNRMPVILPLEAHADWLNIRYNGEDVLRAAVTHVSYTNA